MLLIPIRYRPKSLSYICALYIGKHPDIPDISRKLNSENVPTNTIKYLRHVLYEHNTFENCTQSNMIGIYIFDLINNTLINNAFHEDLGNFDYKTIIDIIFDEVICHKFYNSRDGNIIEETDIRIIKMNLILMLSNLLYMNLSDIYQIIISYFMFDEAVVISDDDYDFHLDNDIIYGPSKYKNYLRITSLISFTKNLNLLDAIMTNRAFARPYDNFEVVKFCDYKYYTLPIGKFVSISGKIIIPFYMTDVLMVNNPDFAKLICDILTIDQIKLFSRIMNYYYSVFTNSEDHERVDKFNMLISKIIT